jgi:orotidine-5'-phosphate decarboxylase
MSGLASRHNTPPNDAARERLFCAVDDASLAGALRVAALLTGVVGGLKLGKEFFAANGPQGVRSVAQLDVPLFLDLKFHDIPNTVAGAVRAVLPLKPVIVTVHASGGRDMLKAAVNAARESNNPPLIAVVTVLTSLDNSDLAQIGFSGDVGDVVGRLADLAQQSGAGGVVCSPMEIERLRAQCGADFKLVVPGIRPSGAESGDQKRVRTPSDAIASGADTLVVGRPITNAADPAVAARSIIAEIATAAAA